MQTILTKKEFLTLYVIYYFNLLIFLLASFSPNHRIWGINCWGYFPIYIPISLFIMCGTIPLLVHFINHNRREEPNLEITQLPSLNIYWFVISFIIIAFVFVFYFMRSHTHFLGDGYSLLANTSSDKMIFKTRDFGEMVIHQFIYSLLKGHNEKQALMTYQLISYFGGTLFLISVSLTAFKLFNSLKKRLLLFLGVASGGYMLLFFGYVENYSLFITMVLIFSLAGILITNQKINKWFILIPLTLALFMHIFGVILIPASIYLLSLDTKLSKIIKSFDNKFKTFISLIILATGIWVFLYFYNSSYFFRFAFVAPFKNRFTLEGYTLFSIKHIVDFLNLMMLLLPSLPIIIASFYFLRPKKILNKRESILFLILLISSVGIVFIIDPKLGMPRDWDLLSFSGIPLIIYSYYFLLKNHSVKTNYNYPLLIALSIVINFSILIPRAVTQIKPELALKNVNNYIKLDPKKNLNAHIIIQDYLLKHPKYLSVIPNFSNWTKNYPEWKLNQKGEELEEKNLFKQAIPYFKKAILSHPAYTLSYNGLGLSYLSLKKYDSALEYLKIANGLNPLSATILNNLGTAYFYNRNFKQAEKFWLKSSSINKQVYQPLLNLLKLYKALNQKQKYFKTLIEISTKPNVPNIFIKKLADFYLENGDFKNAGKTYLKALKNGLDTTYVIKQITNHPELKKYLPSY